MVAPNCLNRVLSMEEGADLCGTGSYFSCMIRAIECNRTRADASCWHGIIAHLYAHDADNCVVYRALACELSGACTWLGTSCSSPPTPSPTRAPTTRAPTTRTPTPAPTHVVVTTPQLQRPTVQPLRSRTNVSASQHHNKLTGADKAGIVIGVFVILALITVFILYLKDRHLERDYVHLQEMQYAEAGPTNDHVDVSQSTVA
eukprot:m.174249 g.174249  ORF g.174249 m.174249 type:complete len:202 (+) comp18327_c0_seq4:2602-3207(+)